MPRALPPRKIILNGEDILYRIKLYGKHVNMVLDLYFIARNTENVKTFSV
jgi:hypothetical protein